MEIKKNVTSEGESGIRRFFTHPFSIAISWVLTIILTIYLTQYFERNRMIELPRPILSYTIYSVDSMPPSGMPTKRFLIYVENEGEANADSVKVQLNTYQTTDIGLDPDVYETRQAFDTGDSTKGRVFRKRDPLLPGRKFKFNVVMDEESFSKYDSAFHSKPKNEHVFIPTVKVESIQCVGIEKKL